MKRLAVYYNDIEAGILTEKFLGVGYTFQYNEDYINSKMPPISATLPIQSTAYKSECLFSFFSNMLPEGANRRVICRAQKIDENDLFSLLEVMADKDFIGAINIRRITDD